MTLLLSWRLPSAPLQLGWRGDSGILAAVAAVQAAANPAQQIPTIIGPVGPPGPAIIGPAGPPGPAFDLDNAVIDGGTFN
jgi:hypothetical protein